MFSHMACPNPTTSGVANIELASTSVVANKKFAVGSFDTPGAANNVAISGDYAYVADSSPRGLQIINVGNAALPTRSGSFDTTNDAYCVVVSGGYAFVGAGDIGLQIINVSNLSAPTLTGTFDTQNSKTYRSP